MTCEYADQSGQIVVVDVTVAIDVVIGRCGLSEDEGEQQAGQVTAVNAAIAVQIGTIGRCAGGQFQGDQHRVVVRGTVGIRCVEAGLLFRRFVLGVVIQGTGFVSVDGPDGGGFYFGGQ